MIGNRCGRRRSKYHSAHPTTPKTAQAAPRADTMTGPHLLPLLLLYALMLPVTGITLPLVSYGGSSLLSGFAAIGLVCNIAIQPVRTMGKATF